MKYWTDYNLSPKSLLWKQFGSKGPKLDLENLRRELFASLIACQTK